MTSRQLAERAGISAQSMSRIERGRHDVVFSTLRRLLAAMNFELADLAAIDHVDVSADQVRAALVASGLQPDTVGRVLHGAADTPSVLARVRSIFGWSATDLAGPGLPPLLATPALAGRFKDHARDRRAAATYVLYVHKIALLADQAVQRPDYRPPPDDPRVIADAIRSTYGDLRFASVAQFCWERGIVIVPLADRGQFHGACWLVGGRPIIVLKQTTALDSRWVFDLGHEVCHVLRHLRPGHDAIVELEEIGRDHDAEETEASDFSGELLLGDPDRLAHAVVDAAGSQGNRIWRHIGPVATREQVNPGVLANYLAHRLDRENVFKGGWGAAANLQQGDTDAPATARGLLFEHLDFGRLTDDDAQVLTGALGRDEETP
jgi:transcriptional regulator with XRE-family HTH domain